MEKDARTRLLDAALELLGTRGGAHWTVRATEAAAGLPHGSVRHHFGDRAGLVAALFDHLAQREGAAGADDPAAALAHWVGPGRTLALARYELFLLAARDPALRPPLVRARDAFVAAATQRVGADAAPAVVAALDGLVLDALVRGDDDPARLSAMVAQILRGSAGQLQRELGQGGAQRRR
jgi:AcrR family transcriptional regulator